MRIVYITDELSDFSCNYCDYTDRWRIIPAGQQMLVDGSMSC